MDIVMFLIAVLFLIVFVAYVAKWEGSPNRIKNFIGKHCVLIGHAPIWIWFFYIALKQ